MVSRATKSSPCLGEILARGLGMDALAVEALAVEAAAFATGDSFGAWSEFPSDFRAGLVVSGDTAEAGSCPESFPASAALNKSTSVAGAAIFSTGSAPELAPELGSAEALPVWRMPNPRTMATSTTAAKLRAARQYHATERPVSSGFHLRRIVYDRPIVDGVVVGLAIIGLAIVGLAIVGLAIVGLAIVDASDAKWLGGSSGSDGNGSGGEIRRALVLGSNPGWRRIAAAGETALAASCGAAACSSTSSMLGSALKLTGSSEKSTDSRGSGGRRMKSPIGDFKRCTNSSEAECSPSCASTLAIN